jgi:hypothetical protein
MKLRPRKIVVAVVILMGLVALVPAQSRTIWVDPITGSVKTQASGLGIGQTPVIETSSLERWIVEHDGSHLSTWQRVTKATWTIYGQGVDVSCVDRPMFLLRAGESNDQFVRTSTDSQISRFVQVIRTGSKDEKTEAMHAACASVSPDH